MSAAYKVLKGNGAAHHGGTGRWDLPKDDEPGKWKTVRGRIVPCANGLHLCRREDLVRWLGPAIFAVEYEGDPVVETDKIVVARARLVSRLGTWNDRTARLFAADCADRALRLMRKRGLTVDGRSVAAVKAARAFANGEIGEKELAAARDAAWDVAWAVAWDVAWDVAWAVAWDVAWDVAWAVAWDAARATARDADHEWQTKRLFEYLDGVRT